MPQASRTVDRFSIGIDNYTRLGYQKNGEIKLGGYTSRQQYCWESVQMDAMDGIPSGSTILSVSFDVNIVDYESGVTVIDLSIRTQDKGSWADNGSTEPSRAIPDFFDETTEYAEILASVEVPVQHTGIITISSTPELVSKMQGWLDGTIQNDGFILAYYPDHYSYYIDVDSITYTIDYEAGSGARRRIMVIS